MHHIIHRYLPVIYNPSSGEMVIQPAIPTYLLAQRVKRTKVSDMMLNSAFMSTIPHLTKRDQLGEAFGTRKAKSRIRANERNKVDASAQESARAHLMQHIDDAVVSGPQDGKDFAVTCFLGYCNHTNESD
jgi:DNA-directed RNA polymerase I subunit RPA49